MAALVNNFKHASGQSLMSIAKEKIQHVFNAYIVPERKRPISLNIASF